MRNSVLRFLALAACCGCARQDGFSAADAVDAAGGPKIELNAAAERHAAFEVLGLSKAELEAVKQLDADQQAAVFEVHVADSEPDAPAMLGATSIVEGRLQFTPRYGLEPGLRYRAVLHRTKLPARGAPGDDVTTDFAIPAAAAQSPTNLTHIYPTSDRLPENQLKFYLHFSSPMSRGEAYRHIHLLDAEGKEVEAAFLELGEELWDRDQKRFTLLCDPGRVKRGLKPREELGPVLHEGGSYTLVVDGQWRDATGGELAHSARKSFSVSPPDETAIDIAAWKLEPPKAETIEPLTVRFPEPLDHSLLGRVLWVTGTAGERLDGSIEITDAETCWRFKPRQAWTPGEYQLVAQTTLEDLAGNAIGRTFEVDEFGPVQKSIKSETISLPFQVAPAAGK